MTSAENLRSTLEIVAAAQSDDAAAWEALHAKIAPYLSAVLARESLPPHLDREDLIQEVLLEVCKSIRKFLVAEGSSFRSWVAAIARMRVIDAHRRHRARGSEHASGADPDDSGHSAAPEPVAWDASQTQKARDLEFGADLARTLATLHSKQRMILELRIFEELPFDAIRERMGFHTEATARSFFARTKEVLQAALRSHA